MCVRVRACERSLVCRNLTGCLSVGRSQVGKLSKNKKKKLKRKAKRQQRLLEERLVDIQVPVPSSLTRGLVRIS